MSCLRYNLVLLTLLSFPTLAAATIVISEVLADPPDGSAGDSNQDGQSDAYEDEFIELYNAGPNTISLVGWRLGDSRPLIDYFRFPRDAVIAPGSYVVLFGGGTPSGFTVPVYTDDGTIGNGLTDTGETIYLIDSIGGIVDSVFHATWPDDQSIVRTSVEDSTFVPHKTAAPTEALFSPGRAIEAQVEPASKTPAMVSAIALQVWPNPFNTTTHLRFHLSQTASVHVAIYNVQGQRVRTLVDAPLRAGVHQIYGMAETNVAIRPPLARTSSAFASSIAHRATPSSSSSAETKKPHLHAGRRGFHQRSLRMRQF